MRTIVFLLIASSYSLLGSEQSLDTKLICTSFDAATQDGLTALKTISTRIKQELENAALVQAHCTTTIQAADSVIDCYQKDNTKIAQWHTIITTLMHHAQKKRYSLDKVSTIVNALNNESIKTGWRYTILIDKDDLKNKNRFIFGMSMNIGNSNHDITQFIIAPLEAKGDDNQLINNI
ncbi:MAG: hypothetical protein M1114_06760 [Candidatus Dependentiae bacterium]|nr:hypothetical protein [Candidatus Dependentiae bacterium]